MLLSWKFIAKRKCRVESVLQRANVAIMIHKKAQKCPLHEDLLQSANAALLKLYYKK
jgi:hypothetical protein